MVLPNPLSAYVQRFQPPVPLVRFFCRVCRKGYRDRAAVTRHENDKHGPRMKCGQCRFSCPECRPSEMRAHLRERHGITSSPTQKRRRLSRDDLVPHTERIPAESLAVSTYSLGATSVPTTAVSTGDIGPEPDVSIGEPSSVTLAPVVTTNAEVPLPPVTCTDSYSQVSETSKLHNLSINSPSSEAAQCKTPPPVSSDSLNHLSTPVLKLNDVSLLCASEALSPAFSCILSPESSVCSSPESPLDATLAEYLDGACGSTSSDFNLTPSTRNFDPVLSQSISDKSPPSLFSGIDARTTESEVSLPDQVTSVPMANVSKPVNTSAGCPSSMYDPALVSVSGLSSRQGTSVPYTPTPLAALSESKVSVALVTTVESSTQSSSSTICLYDTLCVRFIAAVQPGLTAFDVLGHFRHLFRIVRTSAGIGVFQAACLILKPINSSFSIWSPV